MSESTEAGAIAGTVTTNSTAANAPPPIPAGLSSTATQAQLTPQPADESQPWFKERLDRERAKEREALLSEIGAKDPKAAKAAVDAANKAAEEAKTVTDKLTDATKLAAKHESEAERLRKITAEWAGRQMIALTPEQQAAVKAVAGDDPAEQLKAITALTPTWAKQPASSTQALPTPPASGTAPAPTQPAGTQLTSPADHKAVHAALLKTNPFAAASYALEHAADVFPDQPSQ